MENEIWKDIPGYEGCYQLSNMGRIKSIHREFITKSGRRKVIKEKIKLSSINHKGYERTQLTDVKGKKIIYSVHRLIAQSFIPNPENKPQVNHKKGIKTDNRASELEWCTKTENENHAVVYGLKPIGDKHPMAILNQMKVAEIKNMLAHGEKGNKLAKKFNVHVTTISAIKNGRIWK